MVTELAVFIDTGVFVAAYNTRDRYHEPAKRLLRNALKNRYGQVYTSDYIFDETVTVVRSRVKNKELARQLGTAILGSAHIEILRIDDQAFSRAWEEFQTHLDRTLSFTDCTSIVLMKTLKIGTVLSFDSHFDGFTADFTRIGAQTSNRRTASHSQ